MGNSRPLRVCYFGTYRSNYNRNQIMITGLKLNGVEVIECHVTLWHSIEDRVQIVSGGWLHPKFWWRVLVTYWKLLRLYRRVGDYDLLMIGYPGQSDVIMARLLSWLRGKPLVWDVFMSIYLIALERKLDSHSPITVNFLRWFEHLALRLPDMLIQDTNEYVAWFEKTYGISPKRFRLVPTGADNRIFHPKSQENMDNSIFRVIYYGTFIPNHGVEFIVEAAHILEKNKSIHIELIGNGPDKAKVQSLTREYKLSNVTFLEWLDKTELVLKMAHSDVCLGTFGTTPQSLMTIHNKIYEALSMEKPVITGDSPAIRSTFTHLEHVFLIKRKSPADLANAILTLRYNPKTLTHIREAGHRFYLKHFSLKETGRKTQAHLESLLTSKE